MTRPLETHPPAAVMRAVSSARSGLWSTLGRHATRRFVSSCFSGAHLLVWGLSRGRAHVIRSARRSRHTYARLSPALPTMTWLGVTSAHTAVLPEHEAVVSRN